MMTAADSYGQALFELGVTRETILQSREIMCSSEALQKALSNPSVTPDEKHRVIDRLFPLEIRNFLKVVCDNGRMNELKQIRGAYEECYLKSQNMVSAEFIYANEPDPKQILAIKDMIRKKYKKAGVELVLSHEPKLLGGFILRVGTDEYDRSTQGRLKDIYKKLAWR